MKLAVFDSNLFMIRKTFRMSAIVVCPDHLEIRKDCYTTKHPGLNQERNGYTFYSSLLPWVFQSLRNMVLTSYNQVCANFLQSP
jgi:hypothetical protein